MPRKTASKVKKLSRLAGGRVNCYFLWFTCALTGAAAGLFAGAVTGTGHAVEPAVLTLSSPLPVREDTRLQGPFRQSAEFAGEERLSRKTAPVSAPLKRPRPAARRAPQPAKVPARPRIAIVIDDMGFDLEDTVRLSVLSQPVTLSFLPYVENVQLQADLARRAGHEVMLHLPMEPMSLGGQMPDAGPDTLKLAMSEAELSRTLAANLGRFTGFSGVNNHMGSRLTTDTRAMTLILKELDRRGIWFLDSVTHSSSRVALAADRLGMPVLERSVFLDSEGPALVTAQIIRDRLAEAEDIARREGEAVVIGHPYDTTIDALSEWLAEAQNRELDIVPASALLPRPTPPQILASAEASDKEVIPAVRPSLR